MKITASLRNRAAYQKTITLKKATRQFFEEKNYTELDLPLLSPALIPESYLEVFETEFRYFKERHKLYLTPSPELFIKRLLVEGIGDCYFLGKAFRNSEPASSLHLPEFTMLEFYKTGVNYNYMKKELKELVCFLAEKHKKKHIVYQNHTINVDTAWQELTVKEAFSQYADVADIFDETTFFKKAAKKGYMIDKTSYVDLFSQVYVQEIEPHLGVDAPTIIFDYPQKLAALAQLKKDGKTAERFELYIAGVELADCYSELTDWKKQKERFSADAVLRKKEGKIKYPIDWDFIDALKKGLPKCAGVAVGFDRLAMLFVGAASVRELQLIAFDRDM